MTFTPAEPLSVAAFVAIVGFVLGAIAWGAKRAAAQTGKQALARRITLLLAAWFVVTSAIVASGVLSGDPFPAFPLFFALILGSAVAFALTAPGRLLATGLPVGALVGFQAFRLPLELVLHSWFEQGTIPETMTWTGRNYDIVTGVLAIVLAPVAARSPAVAWLFNLVGLGLLLNVLRVAVLSSPLPFAWEVDPPLQLIAHLPYAWIGPVCVAGALAGHVILFRALLQRD